MSLFNSVGTMNFAIFSCKMWMCIWWSYGLCFIIDYTINVYRNLIVSSIRNDIKHIDDLGDLENIPFRLKKLLLLKKEKKKKRKNSSEEDMNEEEDENEENEEKEENEINTEYYDNSVETPNNFNDNNNKIKKIHDNIKKNNHKNKVTKEIDR